MFLPFFAASTSSTSKQASKQAQHSTMPGRHHSSHHDLANLVDGKVGYGILGASESVLEGFNQTH